MGYIYMLTSPNGKTYIGQTTRPIHKRLEEHRKGKIGCCAIYNAIKKHGWENFEKDYYECPNEDLNKHEELMVEVLGTLSPLGYNLKEGGGSNGKMSEESKQRMSESTKGEKHPMFGKNHTEETRQKQSDARIGKKHTGETKRNISEAKTGENNHMFGKNHTEETKQKQRDAQQGEKNHMFGETHNDETKRKMSEANAGEKNQKSKRVYRYDLDGTFIDSFGSSGDAGRYLNKNGANIRACARNVQGHKTAYNFKWSYIFI